MVHTYAAPPSGIPTAQREQYWTELSFKCGASSLSGVLPSGIGSGMSDPSPLVFQLCTAIDRYYDRAPDLSVNDVLAALGEVSMALACAGAPKRSRPNVVRISDYKRSTLTRTITKDIGGPTFGS